LFRVMPDPQRRRGPVSNMNASTNRVSMGALALLMCLALPAGLLSLFAESTTGEQVDQSNVIVVARVASLQAMPEPQRTAVEFAVGDVIWGNTQAHSVNVVVPGRLPLQVGDSVVAILAHRPLELLGVLELNKDARTLAWQVVSPVTGMSEQGLTGGGPTDPVSLALVKAAIRARKGADPRAAAGGGVVASSADGNPLAPDAYEVNNTLATATNLSGLYPPSLLTGNPLVLTGLTLTPNDVDFFAFDAAALTILHAETLAVTGLPAPDTLMGLFDTPAGKLLAHDDDGAGNGLSRFIVPIESTGKYAVAVESAPDTNLDFAGDEGTTTGTYSLSLELELGSYLWNQFDLILGVSPDGTLIEDFVGFKEIGGQDVLLVGVPADGWAVDFDVSNTPLGATHVYGGAGDQLTDPGFANPLLPLSFQLGSYADAAGFNRRGSAEASSLVTYTPAGADPRGLKTDFAYTMSVGSDTVVGQIDLEPATHGQISALQFARVTDIDLFGVGPDQFFWSFSPASPIKAFAVDGSTNVGNVTPPATPFGNATGDMQAAVTIDGGSLVAPQTLHYRTAFTYRKGFTTSVLALNEVVRHLRMAGVDTWVVAVDKDPQTGLYAAFGTGLGDL
jgi:hypothetical protein